MMQQEVEMMQTSKVMKRPLLEVTVDEELPPVVPSNDGAPPSSSPAVSPHADEIKSSTTRAALNTIKSIVGVGILSFPFAFRQAGLIFGLLSVVLIAMIVNYGMRLLVDVRTEANRSLAVPLDTSEEVAKHVGGRVAYVVSVAAICVTQIGIGCAYVLFVANQLFAVQPALNVQEWALVRL